MRKENRKFEKARLINELDRDRRGQTRKGRNNEISKDEGFLKMLNYFQHR
jgi:hypothetical protein